MPIYYSMDISEFAQLIEPNGSKFRLVPEALLRAFLESFGALSSSSNTVDQIRLLRISKGLTQEDFAKKLGITQSKLSRIEAGTTPLKEPLKKQMFQELI